MNSRSLLDTSSLVLPDGRTLAASLALWSVVVLPLALFLPRRQAPLAARLAFGLSLAGILAVTLFPSGGALGGSGTCTVNKEFLALVSSGQWLANAALFVPAGLLGVVVWHRPVSVAVGLCALSAAVETAQGAVGLGRACDSDDLMANTAGAVAGAAAGALVRYALRRAVAWRAGPRSAGTLGVVLAAALALVAADVVLPVVAGASGVVPVTAEHRAAARDAARGLFGPDAAVTSVDYLATPDEDFPDLVMVRTAQGWFNLAWPDRQPTQGEWDRSGSPPRDGAAVTRREPDEAVARGTAYARAAFPWIGDLGAPFVTPAGPGGEQRLTWRHIVDGVVMPSYLELVVDADGARVSFRARRADPPPVPQVRVDLAAALATARAATRAPALGDGVLVMVRNGGRWRLAWQFAELTPDGRIRPGGWLRVDATTGRVLRGPVA